ncbi:hypothetical protein [Desulfoferrobacter suflitae]|uniref:hypothetical protein n=1 Tax=Desulfoferrobacter suflitae TaxID=2865782 RepID=UPI002164D78F|nr:hypothetical protein [Desulfoferrobacter suflitae]MCK8604045.1 hypothetical protein [Desulfoferrobacter suflitae]
MRHVLAERHHMLLLILLLSTWAIVVGGCATVPEEHPAPVSVAEILDMSKSGVPPDEIIQEIAESGTVYRFQASQLADLEKQGVAPSVIDYMQQTYLDSVASSPHLESFDYWTQEGDGYWYGGMPYGWDPNILP